MSSGKSAKRGKSILAVILCIPLAFIVYFLITYFSQSLGNVKQVTLTAPDGTETVFTNTADIEFFVNIIEGKKNISTAMRDVSGEEPVYIIYERSDRTITYSLYPTLNLSGCLLVGPDNRLYVLDSDSAGQLLLRDEFEYLYARNFLPTLYIVSGDNREEVLPTESDWKYTKSDGNEYTYTLPQYASGEEIYSIYRGNENTLSFEPGADTRQYEMTDISYLAENGAEYMIRDISELDLSVDTLVNVSFTVKWSSLNGADCYGEAKYSFKVLYDIPAEVTISGNEFTVGEVIVISATHLNESEKIELSTELDTTGLMFTMTDVDKGVALLPIGLGNAEGSYDLHIRTGSGETTETITVHELDNAGSWTPVQVSTEDYEQMLTPELLDEAEKALDAVTGERPGEEYITYGVDALREPVSKSTVLYNFGDIVNLANAEISGDAGNHLVSGKVYSLSNGTNVRSAQAGLVVFSGELAPTGKTVVIYHGCGIYTYYFHLDSVNVQEGYTLTSGEIIGVAGKTGYTGDRTMLHFAVSIDGYFVNPGKVIG